MAQDPGGTCHSGEYLLAVLHLIRHTYIADTLTGQGQGLGVGVADDGVGVDGGDKGHLYTVVHQLPVRLVSDDVNGMAVLRALPGQQGSHLFQGFPGIHYTGGVVGRVDDDGLGVGRQLRLQGLQGDLEGLRIRRDHAERGAATLHKGAVFREEGGDGQDLGIFHRQRPDHGQQGGSRAAGEENVLSPDRRAKAAVQVLRHGLSGLHAAGGRRVAVDCQAIHIPDNGDKGLFHLGGSRDGGIAQRIIIYILAAHHSRLPQAIFKQLPDTGAGGPQFQAFFRYHSSSVLSRVSAGVHIGIYCLILHAVAAKWK